MRPMAAAKVGGTICEVAAVSVVTGAEVVGRLVGGVVVGVVVRATGGSATVLLDRSWRVKARTAATMQATRAAKTMKITRLRRSFSTGGRLCR